MANKPLQKNAEIAKRVRELTRAGVPVGQIFADIQSYAFAPGSYTTFYKYYGQDMEAARAAITEAVGSRVINQAINGDPEQPTTWKSQELYLRSHGGWSPKSTEQTQEVGNEPEEAESAVDAMMKFLGKSSDESEEI